METTKMTKRDPRDYSERPRSEPNPDLKHIGERKDRRASIEGILRDDADGNSDNSGLADVLPKV
jgi:hypothetical protein